MDTDMGVATHPYVTSIRQLAPWQLSWKLQINGEGTTTRTVEVLQVGGLRPERPPVNERVRTRELTHRGHVEVAICKHPGHRLNMEEAVAQFVQDMPKRAALGAKRTGFKLH